VPTTPRLKTGLVKKQIHVPRAWSDPLVQPKQWKRNMKFGTWKVRSLCRAGSLTAAFRELVGVQEVRWDSGGSVTAGYYISFEKRC
jgi:hypothetical protein